MTESDLKNILVCINRVRDFTGAEVDEVTALKARIVAEINCFHTPPVVTLPPVMEEPL